MVKRLMIVAALTAVVLPPCNALGQSPTATLAPTSTDTPIPIPTQVIATEPPATEPPAAAKTTAPGPSGMSRAGSRKNCRTNSAFTLGADVALGAGWRTVGEWTRTTMPDYDIAIASTRGYAALLRRVEQWTPYVVYAFLRSDSTQRDFYRAVNFNRVPDIVPGAALINASQRMGADGTVVWDQYSWSVVTAYSFSPTSKIKAEASQVRVALVSRMVDAPSGGDVQNQDITVLSLSYNFVF